MGDTGYIKKPTNDENDLEGIAELVNSNGVHTFSSADKWFKNPKISNYAEWKTDLTDAEDSAISYYVSSAYKSLNKDLYNNPWEQMDSTHKKRASDLFEALNKFELNKSVRLLRLCDAQIFGLPQGQKITADDLRKLVSENDGTFQTNGFLSFTTNTTHGTYSHNSGLAIDLVMPPNKGGGAWLGGHNSSEQEFLLNSNAVLKFDPNSITKDQFGRLRISATWVGQAADQAFNAPVYKPGKKTKKK